VNKYSFAVTFSGGAFIWVDALGYTEVEARHAAWSSLTDAQRDCIESIECCEQVAA